MENNTVTGTEEMIVALNLALENGGYKPAEARATAWSGPTEKRIYLNGKKANGYLHIVNGKWVPEEIKFINVLRIVEAAIAAK